MPFPKDIPIIDLMLSFPILDHDRTYDWSQPQALWNGIKGSQLAVVPGCAHAVHLEAPEIFNSLVDRFLNSV